MTPVLKHTDECSGCEMGGDFVFCHVCEADTLGRSANYELQVVDYQRPGHSYRHGLLSFFKLPSVQACGTVAEVDAAVLQEVARQLRSRMGVE